MTALLLRGVPASAGLGVAVGRALVLDEVTAEDYRAAAARPSEDAVGALRRVAEELTRQARSARDEGRIDEADILEASGAMATDPGLVETLRAHGGSAGAALLEATEAHALRLEQIDDPHLAALACDVRELGRRAMRVLAGSALPPFAGPAIVVAADLGPADVAELSRSDVDVRGVALAGGSGASHTAIVAQALDLPLVVGVGSRLLSIPPDGAVAVDGSTGQVHVGEQIDLGRLVARTMGRPIQATVVEGSARSTSAARRVAVLCNASSVSEVRLGLRVGVPRIGLVRSEVPFLGATRWPTRADHVRILSRTLAPATGASVTVRTLDFGGDKLSPFLAGESGRGIALQLAHPRALADQACALLRVAARFRLDLRVLLPFVVDPDEVRAARAIVDAVALDEDVPVPALGAMVETVASARAAEEIAGAADFVAIGTNDLAAATLGISRRAASAVRGGSDPQVLALVAAVTEAAHAAGRRVGVCGEAAADPDAAVLFAGLGVDELSVSPVRVGPVRRALAHVDFERAAAAARLALASASAVEALELAAALRSGERGDDSGELADGRDRVLS